MPLAVKVTMMVVVVASISTALSHCVLCNTVGPRTATTLPNYDLCFGSAVCTPPHPPATKFKMLVHAHRLVELMTSSVSWSVACPRQ